MTDIAAQALEHYGAAEQVQQCMEELAELIVALQHNRRGRSADVVGEIADVWIMLTQMRLLFGPEAVDDAIAAKLERLQRRMQPDPSLANTQQVRMVRKE